MIAKKKNGLVFYTFELFEPFERLSHGVFTRQGGLSRPPYDALNLAFNNEEPQEVTAANLDRVAEALGFDGLAAAGQVHGDKALVVRAQDDYCPRRADEVVRGYDALITPDAGVALLTKLADCQGVMLFDPKTDTLALVHSGWRGSVGNAIGKTVARLEAEFEVDPGDLLAGIGPSLGPCCAEFVNYRTELPESFLAYRNGNYFDFWAASRDQLTGAGLRAENIETAGICTVCGREGFYSYRREKKTGRFGLAAGILREDEF
jgi:YfiH family protein